jgi:hypothetical protein
MYSSEEIIKYKNEIKNLIIEKPSAYVALLKNKKFSYLFNFINEMTPKLNDEIYSLSTKVFWILNDLNDFPICPLCGKSYGENINVSINRGYPKTCSVSCGSLYSMDKKKQTNLEKYGVDNPAKSLEVKEKINKTCLEKYGTKVANQYSSEELKEKFKNRCLEKYGVETPVKNETLKNEFLRKGKETRLLKYGDENYNNRELAKQTCLEKYGVENPNKNKNVRKKIEETCLKRYGTTCSSKSDKVKEKTKSTLIKRYGVNSPMESEIFKKRNELTKAKKRYKQFLEIKEKTPLFDFNEYWEHKNDVFYEYEWKCNNCGEIFSDVINKNWFNYTREFARCLKCSPLINCGISNCETEVVDFIKSIYNDEIILNSRQIISPFELDIYLLNKSLAFEFDGLYFHSERSLKSNDYHLMKTNMCSEKGIQLIHIFENEWRFKRNIVKSRIKNLLGIYDETIYARKCEIKIVNTKDKNNFLFENHLQGECNSKVNLGLFFENKLVSLMTFGKPRYNKNYEWELLRFCNLCNYHIPGGASKLLSFFEKHFNPKSIISYADKRWSTGNLYQKLNFKFSHNTMPDYWFWKNSEFSHRSKYQKYKMKNIKDFIFDENLTGLENMINNGFNRIFDCGNFVYIKEYN